MRQVLEVGLMPGDRIGNYRVERELGPTGSGVLLSAQHLVLPRKAIVKVVHPAFVEVRLFVLQTLREACILEAIAHPGVPIVYESGVLRDRRPWFAFEPIAGATLEDLLTAPLPLIQVANLLRDLSDILDHAHRRGVSHRRLRPYRVVITPDRRYPLCIPDWSEAMAHDAAGHLPGSAHQVSEDSGTYIAPELVAEPGEELVDARVDMFALGVIGYRALTGLLPVSLVRNAAQHSAAQTRRVDDCIPGESGGSGPGSARELRPDAPRELVAIIDSLLAVDRCARPSASEVRGGIDGLLDTLPGFHQLTGHRTGHRAAGDQVEADIVVDPIRLRTSGGSAPGSPRDPVVDTPGLRTSGAAAPGVPRDRVVDSPGLRKPRWTPEAGYVETTDVDIAAPGDDASAS